MKPRYIAHTGGDMPVQPGCIVGVLFKDGNLWGPAKAREWGAMYEHDNCWWRHESGASDNHIIAYRVIEQENDQ